jgi:hypothetical protein
MIQKPQTRQKIWCIYRKQSREGISITERILSVSSDERKGGLYVTILSLFLPITMQFFILFCSLHLGKCLIM